MNDDEPDFGFVRMKELISSFAVIVKVCASERSRVTSFEAIDGEETDSE